MTHVRQHLALTAATAGLLVVATPAAAAQVVAGGPVRSTFTLPGPVPFGPCPTVAQITALTVERREMSFTTRDGAPVRTVAHVSFTGTLTGVNGEQIPYSGHFKVVDDVRRGVRTTTGLNGRAVLPDGEVVLAAGRRTETIGTGELLDESGANTFGQFNDEICGAFAG